MRTTRFAIWTALFGAAISQAAAFADAPPACSVVTRADVEELAGTPVGEGKAGVMERGASSCSFAGAHGGQISVLVRRVPSGGWRHEQVARMQGGAYREVQGIGERSFLYTLRGNAVLCVFASEYYLQISARRIEGSTSVVSKLGKRAITALAQFDSGRNLALARMGRR